MPKNSSVHGQLKFGLFSILYWVNEKYEVSWGFGGNGSDCKGYYKAVWVRLFLSFGAILAHMKRCIKKERKVFDVWTSV